jgi:hypothetical protein
MLDRGKLLTPPIDRVQDELRQPRVTWHFNVITGATESRENRR